MWQKFHEFQISERRQRLMIKNQMLLTRDMNLSWPLARWSYIGHIKNRKTETHEMIIFTMIYKGGWLRSSDARTMKSCIPTFQMFVLKTAPLCREKISFCSLKSSRIYEKLQLSLLVNFKLFIPHALFQCISEVNYHSS